MGKGRKRLLCPNLKVLSEMLHLDIFSKLPLHLLFTNNDVHALFMKCKPVPTHISIRVDEMESLKICVEARDVPIAASCHICALDINLDRHDSWIRCTKCSCTWHLLCASEKFTEGSLIPVSGVCTGCGISCKWGDLIDDLNERIKWGCRDNIVSSVDEDDVKSIDSDTDLDEKRTKSTKCISKSSTSIKNTAIKPTVNAIDSNNDSKVEKSSGKSTNISKSTESKTKNVDDNESIDLNDLDIPVEKSGKSTKISKSTKSKTKNIDDNESIDSNDLDIPFEKIGKAPKMKTSKSSKTKSTVKTSKILVTKQSVAQTTSKALDYNLPEYITKAGNNNSRSWMDFIVGDDGLIIPNVDVENMTDLLSHIKIKEVYVVPKRTLD